MNDRLFSKFIAYCPANETKQQKHCVKHSANTQWHRESAGFSCDESPVLRAASIQWFCGSPQEWPRRVFGVELSSGHTLLPCAIFNPFGWASFRTRTAGSISAHQRPSHEE
jgi:hypothetical protein